MCMVGVLLGSIGTDVNSGLARFTWDAPFLADGVGIVSIALKQLRRADRRRTSTRAKAAPFNGEISSCPPGPVRRASSPARCVAAVNASWASAGGGFVIAQFAAYALDKKVSKYRDEITAPASKAWPARLLRTKRLHAPVSSH